MDSKPIPGNLTTPTTRASARLRPCWAAGSPQTRGAHALSTQRRRCSTLRKRRPAGQGSTKEMWIRPA
eukprot:11175153-Lingulodinium_polyedra.AAC.1